MRIIALALPALMLAACGHAEGSASESSAITTKQFALTDFDQVALRGSDDVDVIVGKGFSVSATGPQSVIDRLEIVVEGGVLKVGRKKDSAWHMNWSDKGHAKITVTMPAIRGAKLAGSGDMKVDRAEADAFGASVAGSGNLKIGAVQAKTVDLNVAGSGNLDISGQTTSASLSSAGSGEIIARGLKAETADVSVAGSGNASVQATASASVSVVGSGNVEVSGTDKCKISKLGSGDVTCKI